MQNKLMWGIVVLVVIAGGAYFFMKDSASVGIETPPQFMSLKDLRGRTGQQTCTFTSTTQNSQSQGTVYLNNGMMRGNFTSVANGQSVASHMIVKDDSVYVWSDGLAQGYKMDVSTLDTPPSQGSQSGIDATAPVGYDCKAGNIDSSVFELPAGITFSTVGAATVPAGSGIPAGAADTGASAGASASVHAAQCQACDQAPNAATKAQCRQALAC